MPFDFDLSTSRQTLLRHELERQQAILYNEAPVRFVASVFAYIMAAVFMPVAFVVMAALVNLAAEVGSYLLMRDVPTLLSSKTRHWGVVACTFVLEACFVLPPALMWQLDNPLLKALAVGTAISTMMHVSTVRAIHLPMGLSGALAIAITVLGSNVIYWSDKNDLTSMAVSTLCALICLGYFLSALLSNNRLHHETMSNWAEAESANAAKSRFLAQMSHELRTPLNAILGMGHAERARQTDPITRARLDLLIDSAAGLGVLLDDILDLSAVQEGRLPIRPEAIEPRAILMATVALFRPQAEAAGLRLDLITDPNLPAFAKADGRRLRQCVSNILSNAIKYTDRGSVRLSARMTAENILQIDVQDTGQGVPDDLRDRLFEPFTRGPGQQAGSGLGLTISRTLARRMGGDLVLVPQPGGARFCLTLPLGPAEPPAASLPPAPLDLAGRLILVVDDIATNRLVAATYLRMFGAEVAEAESGEVALRMLALSQPSAILLDMNMPGLSGVETLRRLRQAEAGRHRTPVIAMTADATDDHRRAYLAAGLDGYVAKPLSPDQMAEALRPHLDWSETSRWTADYRREVG